MAAKAKGEVPDGVAVARARTEVAVTGKAMAEGPVTGKARAEGHAVAKARSVAKERSVAKARPVAKAWAAKAREQAASETAAVTAKDA